MKISCFKFATTLFAYATISTSVSLDCPQAQLCLTSFGKCYQDHEEACRPPSGSKNSAQPLVLFGGTNYTISWVFGADGQVDAPVRIQWQMDSVIWEMNTTASEYIFNPGNILASFPTAQAPNMSPEAAWFDASQYSGNLLVISQPEAVGLGNDFPVVLSQQFTVQSHVMDDYTQTQIKIGRQIEYNKWRLGISIGLGIGIPFLVCITILGVLAAVRIQPKKKLDEGVDIASNEAEIY